MIEKIKKIFDNKEKRIENLVVLLVILIVTIIIINSILEDEKSEDYENKVGVELAVTDNIEYKDYFEKRLEKILEKIKGVGEVSVLITYSENNSESLSSTIVEDSAISKVEGAIVTAQGASNAKVRGNIISAIEAVTGISAHKIKVYEMGDK